MALGLALGLFLAGAFLPKDDSPLPLYLDSVRQMNLLYIQGDISGMTDRARLADALFDQSIASGDLITIRVKQSDESEFSQILSTQHVRPYLSGSQMMGGQRASGSYALERTDYLVLRQDSSRFNQIASTIGRTAP